MQTLLCLVALLGLAHGQSTYNIFRDGKFYNNWEIVKTTDTNDGVTPLQGSQWVYSDLQPQEALRFAVVGDSAQTTNGYGYLTMKVYYSGSAASLPVYVRLHSNTNYEAYEQTLQGYEVVLTNGANNIVEVPIGYFANVNNDDLRYISLQRADAGNANQVRLYVNDVMLEAGTTRDTTVSTASWNVVQTIDGAGLASILLALAALLVLFV